MLGKAAMIAVLLAPTASIARHDDHSTEANSARWRNVAGLLLHRRAQLRPGRDPGIGRFLVDAFRQTGNPDAADQLAIDGERHAAADQIDLAGIHVHDPEIAIRPRLVER